MKKFIHIALSIIIFALSSVSVHADAEPRDEFNFYISEDFENSFINFAVQQSSDSIMTEAEFFGTLGLSFYREALRQEFQSQNPNISERNMNLYLDSFFQANTGAIMNSINNNISSVRNTFGNLWNDFSQTNLAQGWRSVLDTIGDALTWWRPRINELVSDHIAPNIVGGGGFGSSGLSFNRDRFGAGGFGGEYFGDFGINFMMFSDFVAVGSYYRDHPIRRYSHPSFWDRGRTIPRLHDNFPHFAEFDGFYFVVMQFRDSARENGVTASGSRIAIQSPHFFINDSFFNLVGWETSRVHAPYISMPFIDGVPTSQMYRIWAETNTSSSNLHPRPLNPTQNTSNINIETRPHDVFWTRLEYFSIVYVMYDNFNFNFRLDEIMRRLDELDPREVTIINIENVTNNNFFDDGNNSPHSPNRPGVGGSNNNGGGNDGGGNNNGGGNTGGDDGGGGFLGLLTALLNAISNLGSSLVNLGNTIVSGILDGLGALLSSLFVPREGFLESNTSSLSDLADERLNYRQYVVALNQLVDFVSPRTISPYAGGFTPYGLADFELTIVGASFIVPLSMFDSYITPVRHLLTSLVTLWLIFYNLKVIRRMLGFI